MKKIITFLMMLSALCIFASCKKGVEDPQEDSPKELTKKDADFYLQVFNESSHPVEVWPETTTKTDGILTTYDKKSLKAGEYTTFYLSSEKILSDLENYKKANGKTYNNETDVFMICGVKQTDTNQEGWTSGYSLSYLKDCITYVYIKDDLTKRKNLGGTILREDSDTASFTYTFNNNTETTVYVNNYIPDSGNNKYYWSEIKAVGSGSSVSFDYNLAQLKEKFPNLDICVRYYADVNAPMEGWGRSVSSLQNNMYFDINSLTDTRYNHTHITATKMDKYKAATDGDFAIEITNQTGSSILITDYIYDTKINNFWSSIISQSKGQTIANGATVTLKYSTNKLLADYDNKFRIGFDCTTENNLFGSWWSYDILQNMSGKKAVYYLTKESGELKQIHNYYPIDFVSQNKFIVSGVQQNNGKCCYFVDDTPKNKINCYNGLILSKNTGEYYFEAPASEDNDTTKNNILTKLQSGDFTIHNGESVTFIIMDL